MLLFVGLASGFQLTLVQVLARHIGLGDGQKITFFPHLQMRLYVGCVPRGPVEQTLSGSSDKLMEQIIMERSWSDQVWNDEGELRQP